MTFEHEQRDALRERFAAHPPLPDRVLREVFERVPETPQQGAARTSPTPGRFHFAISATKFVVASVIVAIFGGFVVFGVLAPSTQDALPGTGTSPSPSSSPTRSDADMSPTASPKEDPMQLKTPVATALATALALIPTSLLAQEPTFVSVQVEPGVERIVSDGAELGPDHDFTFLDIAAGPDGEIWVVGDRRSNDTGESTGLRAWELGSPGSYEVPGNFTKLVIPDDGMPVVVGRTDGEDVPAISAFDGEGFVKSPGTRRVDEGNSTIWLVEPEDLSTLGPGFADFWASQAGPLVFSADVMGYTMGDQMGRRLIRDYPSWWVACQPELVGYRDHSGCETRSVHDQRGVGVGHDDESSALFLADTVTTRLVRASDGSIWVISGDTINDLQASRSDQAGAIFRIDPAAPGFDCRGC